MILSNEIVTLRAIEESDATIMHQMINDPEIENSVVGYSYPVSLSQQKKWITELSNDNAIRYAIDDKSGFVGTIFLSSLNWKNRTANINIKLIKEARGKGYAFNASKLLVEYCFDELNLSCVTASVIDYNANSKKLWGKLGFKQEGILRNRIYKNGRYHNLLIFSLLRSEFDERNW